jgi:ATP-dependent Clp protease ATP-binding subunit ClpA
MPRKVHKCCAFCCGPQAIDLIDEAGSRVRLRHAQLPEEARDLDKELRALLKEKDAAVRGQVLRPGRPQHAPPPRSCSSLVSSLHATG